MAKRFKYLAALPALLAVPAVLAQISDPEFTVGDILIEGPQRISEVTVFNYLPVNIGDRLDARRRAPRAARPGGHRRRRGAPPLRHGGHPVRRVPPRLLEPIQFPTTVVSIAVEPRSGSDRDRLGEILDRLQREDPTLKASVDPETGQMLLSGIGELHLDVTLQRMERDFGVQLNYGKPRVSHRETVRGPGRGAAEYRRQIGGEALFARVGVAVEPVRDTAAPVQVVDALPQGSLPAVLFAGVLHSVRNAAEGH